MRARPAIVFCATALTAVACTSSAATVRAPGYPVSLGRIVADANAQPGSASFRLAAPGTKVTLSEATAARAVISKCNEGRGTRFLSPAAASDNGQSC